MLATIALLSLTVPAGILAYAVSLVGSGAADNITIALEMATRAAGLR